MDDLLSKLQKLVEDGRDALNLRVFEDKTVAKGKEEYVRELARNPARLNALPPKKKAQLLETYGAGGATGKTGSKAKAGGKAIDPTLSLFERGSNGRRSTRRRRRRHGRRRAGDIQLVPIFFVGPDASSLVSIYSGAKPGGVVEVLDIYNDLPLTLAPTASKGMLGLLITAVSDITADTVITAQSETITPANNLAVVSQHVINGVAYLLALRSHTVTHAVSVTYQYFDFQGANGQEYGPIGPVLTVSRSQALDASYDAVVFAVDLDTAQVSSNAQTIYTYAATPSSFGNFYSLQYTATEMRIPTPLAISSLLPAVHPFKACGSAIWSLTAVEAGPTTTTQQNMASRGLGYFSTQVSRSFNSLLALDTTQGNRVISKSLFANGADQVLELSTYQNNSGSSCALYQDIGLAWADSYSAYAPGDVLDREEVFADLSGLSPADQQLFLSAIYEPPADILPGTSTAGSTSEPIYFMATNTLSQLSIAANQSLALRYWITD